MPSVTSFRDSRGFTPPFSRCSRATTQNLMECCSWDRASSPAHCADYGLWSLNPMTSQSLLYEDFLLYWCPGHLTDCHVQSSGREPPKEDGQAEDPGHH
eukprot:s2624_g5.t1